MIALVSPPFRQFECGRIQGDRATFSIRVSPVLRCSPLKGSKTRTTYPRTLRTVAKHIGAEISIPNVSLTATKTRRFSATSKQLLFL